MSSSRTLLVVALAAGPLAIVTRRAPAQSAAAPARVRSESLGVAAESVSAPRRGSGIRPPRLYGGWIAGAHNSEFRTRTGVPGHRDFYLVGIRVGWPIAGHVPSRTVNGQYFIDFLPLAVSTGMPEYRWDRRCRPGFQCPGATPTRHTVYAYGLAPIGWALSVGSETARLTLEASGGGLWFSRRIPDPEATRFNFTASMGPTLDVALGQSRILRIGYLWHHTSNGGIGRTNPGLNSGIVSVGLLHHAVSTTR